MKQFSSLLFLLFALATFAAPQLGATNGEDKNTGGEDQSNEEITLRLKPVGKHHQYQLTVTQNRTLWQGTVELTPGKLECAELEKGLQFCGTLSENEREFNGFIRSGVFSYQVFLTKTEQGELMGQWNKFVSNQVYPYSTDNHAHYAVYKH